MEIQLIKKNSRSLGQKYYTLRRRKITSVVRSFIATWKTDNAGISASNQIKLPLVNGGTYNFEVDWGDSTIDTITVWNQAETTHTYASIGTYEVKITGTLVRWAFSNGGDKLKILNISSWGNLKFINDVGAFHGCSNLTTTATDTPDLSDCTTMESMFNSATNFNGAIGNWDVSNVTNMSFMFRSATTFNQNIGTWNVSSVTNMSNMFISAIAFNQNISAWNVSSVTDMSSIFNGASVFNQNIDAWDVSSVINMSAAFNLATAFNQDIGIWDVSSVTNMSNMFSSSVFNQDIGNWDISNVITMNKMFQSGTLTTTNYDLLLVGWEAQVEQPNVLFNAGTAQYSAGASATARAALVANGWTITDGGQV